MPSLRPVMVGVKEVVDEAYNVKSFILEHHFEAAPGEFVMVWIPGLDEKPFSLSQVEGEAMITVKRYGPFSEQLLMIEEGGEIGVRGPYGRGFSQNKGKTCLIGGGIGMAPLLPLAKMLGSGVTVIIGADSKNGLVFAEKIGEYADVMLATDDGSAGRKGTTIDVFAELALHGDIDFAYTCGPEPMMAEVAKTCRDKDIPLELSLERYMKCAAGFCGQCCLDPDGLMVCKDGPVFNLTELEGTEFGDYTRDNFGIRKKI